jgi:hypothetical protein
MLFKKLTRAYIWKRIFYERLTEPLHLNLMALPVLLFGSFRSKVAWDLVIRCQHAYGLLRAADQAHELGIKKLKVIEFGVAAGAGLMNLCMIGKRVTDCTGVEFEFYGFDTGKGMPAPQSFRDHPELYKEGDYPMNFAGLQAALPKNCHLVIGEVEKTLPEFTASLSGEAPIGFMSLDFDYYFSSKQALEVLKGRPECYLPNTILYLDDIEEESHNSFCGELLAVHEFNSENKYRKIERYHFLRSYRIMRAARWIDHMFILHVLDHRVRTDASQANNKAKLINPYL